MYIQEVLIEDFMCFKGAYTARFKKDEIIGIVGNYDGDTSQSNRAGKSAFIDAMIWCLYGKSRAKRGVELIHQGKMSTKVTVTVRSDKGKLVVTRNWHKQDGGSLFIQDREGEKKKASQKAIDSFLGQDWGECEATSFFRQNDIDQFMEADSQKKKTILMRWLSQTNWSHYEEEAVAVKQKYERKCVELRAKLDALPPTDFDPDRLKGQLIQIDKTKAKYEKDLAKMSDLKVGINIKIKEIKSLKKRQAELVDIDRKIWGLRKKRPDSDTQEERTKELKAYLDKYPTISEQKVADTYENKDKCVSKLTEIGMKEREVEGLLESVTTNMTGVCPILKQSCDRIELKPKQVEGYKKRLERLEEARAKYEGIRDKCNRIIKLHTKQEEWNRELSQIEERSKRFAHIEEQIADLEREKKKIYDSIPSNADEKIRELEAEAARLPEAEEKLRFNIKSLMESEAQIKQNLDGYLEAKQKAEGIKAAIKEAESDLADAVYVVYMFSKNGIPSIELENSFQEVENDANFILKRLSAPFQFQFEATRELKEWEPACLACGAFFERGERTKVCTECGTPRQKKRKDELQLKIFEGDSERSFYLDSGGGKLLLSVAIRLSLSLLAKRRSGSSWGTIFLDEVFGPLDATNRRKLAELVTATVVKYLGFEQIFLISHDPNIQASTAKKLSITRHPEQGWSELKYG